VQIHRQKELLAVVAKYIAVKEDMIHVTLGKAGNASVLEINVEMPNEAKAHDEGGDGVGGRRALWASFPLESV
jgi:septum formation topological specificity factor MinE